MKRFRFALSARCGLMVALATLSPGIVAGHDTGSAHVHFQRPQIGGDRQAQASSRSLQFRRPSSVQAESSDAELRRRRTSAPKATSAPQAGPDSQTSQAEPPAQRKASVARRSDRSGPPSPVPEEETRRPSFVVAAERDAAVRPKPAQRVAVKNDPSVTPVVGGEVVYASQRDALVRQTGHCDMCLGGCACEPACGMMDPACGCAEPGCGICEPSCGVYEPGCGVSDAMCSCGVPDCGGCVGCGSCVQGPELRCFTICVPKCKDISLWLGVHGFKGPRDTLPLGFDEGNFGFQQGFNLTGSAPIIWRMFPELNFQLGYQAVQSRLSGSVGGSVNDHAQQFLTTGLFRRTTVGLQGGVVFDLLNDDFLENQDFHQVRYEISVRSPKGREIGFMGATHTNNKIVAGMNIQAVDQYVGFVRFNGLNGGEGRIWGGATNDREGIFGADFDIPLSNRFSLQTGFNYLIPDRDAGTPGATEESWNVFTNLVLHVGRTSRKRRSNLYRPLFRVADNGILVVDEVP